MLITGGMIQKILTKQMMMIFLLIRTLTGTHKHIIYLDMKYGNRVLNKGQKRLPSLCQAGTICFKKVANLFCWGTSTRIFSTIQAILKFSNQSVTMSCH